MPSQAQPGQAVCVLCSVFSDFLFFFSALSNGWEEAFHSCSLSVPQHNDGNGCVQSSSVGFQRDALG